MRNPWIGAGGVSGALAVALGAFGAHALKERVPPGDLEIWRTAVLYHAVHALALVLWGVFREHPGRKDLGAVPGWSFLAGTLIFSGTLYGVVLGGPRGLGMVTPIGGVLLIVGWTGFAIQAFRRDQHGA